MADRIAEIRQRLEAALDWTPNGSYPPPPRARHLNECIAIAREDVLFLLARVGALEDALRLLRLSHETTAEGYTAWDAKSSKRELSIIDRALEAKNHA